ncbi:MAG: right-handed parallel beta-helix repeat-containing protein [Alteromonas sp.]|nr:right-handed parallel beta-helix repeat-containing protein [Alteromonas australica]MAO29424.1 right-handed parallel beta-helix repeat-containing protein [Alteromonas sp.]HBF70970.1 right-handed parallel beta-helix repeat-containing protein [Alteromonas australica]
MTSRIARKQALWISPMGALAIALSLVSVADAADTTQIPDKPTSPINLLDNETYDFGGRTIDGGNISDNGLFRCFNRRGVTIKNVTVTNSPRYALLARGCSSVTIENFKMKNMGSSVGGIRFDKGTENKTVTLNSIEADNVGGHAVELWDTNGFTIGTVKANNTDGCGLLLNRSRNGTVSRVEGDGNDQYGGYATFRVANNNGGNIQVGTVKSRNSGRGFFSVSGSHGTTVNYVDIASSNKEGIYIQDSSNTVVSSGKVRGTPNCRIRGGSGNSINADCGGNIAN